MSNSNNFERELESESEVHNYKRREMTIDMIGERDKLEDRLSEPDMI